MKSFTKTIAAGLVGFIGLGLPTAHAEYSDLRDLSYDQRIHHSANHKHNKQGHFIHASSYNEGYYEVRAGRVVYSKGRRNGYRGRDSRILNRDVYNTQFQARIVLVEEVVYGRRGPRLLCTVSVRGPEAEYVPYRRIKRIAYRDCSRRARVRIRA